MRKFFKEPNDDVAVRKNKTYNVASFGQLKKKLVFDNVFLIVSIKVRRQLHTYFTAFTRVDAVVKSRRLVATNLAQHIQFGHCSH